LYTRTIETAHHQIADGSYASSEGSTVLQTINTIQEIITSLDKIGVDSSLPRLYKQHLDNIAKGNEQKDTHIVFESLLAPYTVTTNPIDKSEQQKEVDISTTKGQQKKMEKMRADIRLQLKKEITEEVQKEYKVKEEALMKQLEQAKLKQAVQVEQKSGSVTKTKKGAAKKEQQQAANQVAPNQKAENNQIVVHSPPTIRPIIIALFVGFAAAILGQYFVM